MPPTAALRWAARAVQLARGGDIYKGKTSPHWYDEESFFELQQAAGQRPVREVIAELDGCSSAKAGMLARAFLGRAAASLSREEASHLLATSRAQAREVTPQRLSKVGPRSDLGAGYAAAVSTVALPTTRGFHRARLPVVAEAWLDLAPEAMKHDTHVACHVNVNRTPITSEVSRFYQRRMHELWIDGCGLQHDVAVGQRALGSVLLNIQTPYMPRTTDGKAPDLEPFADLLAEAITKAAAAAPRGRPDPPAHH